jgi:hypothetical protein
MMPAAWKPIAFGLLALPKCDAILITNVVSGKLKIAHQEETYPDGA